MSKDLNSPKKPIGTKKPTVAKKEPVATSVFEPEQVSALVDTVSGKKAPREKCAKVNDVFYQYDVDIFKIDGVYWKESLTAVDISTGQRVVKEKTTLHDVFDKNFVLQKSSKFFAYFLDPKNVKAEVKEKLVNTSIPGVSYVRYWDPTCKNDESLQKMLKVDYPVMMEPKYLKVLSTKVLPAVRNSSDRVYSCSAHKGFKQLCKEMEAGNFGTSKNFDFLPGNFSYGFELETSDGQFLLDQPENYGFVTLYDGSISGHEYASVPMRKNNLGALKSFCETIQKNHVTNRFCSVHIHVGSVPYSQKNLLALYSLFYRLQDELHGIVSPFKKDLTFLTAKLKGESKDHCQYLPKLPVLDMEHFNSAFFGWAKIKPSQYRTEESASILTSTTKWNVESRYFFVNFTNYCMQNEGTIELRLLQGSLDFNRIFNWLAINTAIIQYALTNTDKILAAKDKIFMEDCVNEVYSADIASILNEYSKEVASDNFYHKVQKDNKSADKYFANEKIANTIF